MPVRVQERLLEYFVAGTTARSAARLVGVQGRTTVVFFQRLRQLIASKQAHFLLSSEIAFDDSHVKEKRNVRRSTCPSRQVLIFGLFMRGGRIYTAIIPDASVKTFLPVMQDCASPDSIVYTRHSNSKHVINVS